MKNRLQGYKNFAKAVVFCGLFLIMLITVSYVLRPYSGSASRANLCGFYAEEDQSLDMVFVGSSNVFAFWQPMEFWKEHGITSYDFSTGNFPPQAAKYCIKEILKTQSPELILIDVRPYAVAHRHYYQDSPEIDNMDHEVSLRNVSDNMKYSLNRAELIQKGSSDYYEKLPFYLDIMKYHNEWDRLLDSQSWKYAANSADNINKGFHPFQETKKIGWEDYSDITDTIALDERLDTILRDLLEYCKAEDLNVLLIANIYKISEGDKKTYNYIAEVANEYGFDFLNVNDYQDEIQMNFKTDYYDTAHTNAIGAKRFTDFVGQYLVDHYLQDLEGSRSDNKKWQEDYQVWSENMQEIYENMNNKKNKKKS